MSGRILGLGEGTPRFHCVTEMHVGNCSPGRCIPIRWLPVLGIDFSYFSVMSQHRSCPAQFRSCTAPVLSIPSRGRIHPMPSWLNMVVGESVCQSVVKSFVSYVGRSFGQPCRPVKHAVIGQSCIFSLISVGLLRCFIIRLVGPLRRLVSWSVARATRWSCGAPHGAPEGILSNHAKTWGKWGWSPPPPKNPPPPHGGVYIASAGRPPSVYVAHRSFRSCSHSSRFT